MGAFLPSMTQRMMTGRLRPRQRRLLVGLGRDHHAAPITAYRGAGRPEAAAAIERAIDLFAAEIGMDPAEVRRRNLVPRFLEGYTTGIGTDYDVGDYPEALDRALEHAGYDELRAEQAAAGPRAMPCRWASACRPTSRSRPAGRRRSTARSSCSTTGGSG